MCLSRGRLGALFVERAVLGMASGMLPVALAFAVLDHFGTARALGVVLAGEAVGLIGGLLLLGGLADLVSPRALLLVADLLFALAAGATAALSELRVGAALLWAALALLAGVSSAMANSALQGLLQAVVPAEERQRANGARSIIRTATQTISPAAAGLLAGIGNPALALAVTALGALAGAFVMAAVRDTGRARRGDRFLAELRAGWSAYWQRRWLVWVDGIFAAWHLAVYGPLFVLGPVVARADYGGALGWGAMLAAVGVGGVVGGLVVIRIRPRRPLAVAMAAFSLTTCWLVGLAVAAPLAALLAAAAAAGFGLEVFTGLWDTTFQANVPHDVIGKLAAYDFLASVALLPAGSALAGPLAGALGDRGVFAIGVAVTVLGAAVGLAVPSVRRLAARPAR